MTPVVAVLATLTLVSVTQLITRDVLLCEPRQAVAGWLADKGRYKLLTLVVCPWCASFWLAWPIALGLLATGLAELGPALLFPWAARWVAGALVVHLGPSVKECDQ